MVSLIFVFFNLSSSFYFFIIFRDDLNPSQVHSGPTWGPDKDILECLICKASFSFMTRRHHCRRCGKCVCNKCAPAKNCRPIIEWGFKDSVRHCKLCYMSPIVKWSKINRSRASTISK